MFLLSKSNFVSRKDSPILHISIHKSIIIIFSINSLLDENILCMLVYNNLRRLLIQLKKIFLFNLLSYDCTILLVNEAFSLLQNQHTAVNFVMRSANGIKFKILWKGFLSNVPSRAATITIFPKFAIFSLNSTIYTIYNREYILKELTFINSHNITFLTLFISLIQFAYFYCFQKLPSFFHQLYTYHDLIYITPPSIYYHLHNLTPHIFSQKS